MHCWYGIYIVATVFVFWWHELNVSNSLTAFEWKAYWCLCVGFIESVLRQLWHAFHLTRRYKSPSYSFHTSIHIIQIKKTHFIVALFSEIFSKNEFSRIKLWYLISVYVKSVYNVWMLMHWWFSFLCLFIYSCGLFILQFLFLVSATKIFR